MKKIKLNIISNLKAKLLHRIFRWFFDLNNQYHIFKFNFWEGVGWKKIAKLFFKENIICLKNEYNQILEVRTDQLTDFTAVYGRKDELKILLLLKQYLKHGSIFIDCGAHIGRYSLLASALVKKGKIIAVEPLKQNFVILKKNIKINNLHNIKCLNVGLGNSNKNINLNVGQDLATNTLNISWLNHLEGKNFRRNYVTINMKKLDNIIKDLNLKKIDLIKIDAEGAELDILKGAKDSLRRRIIKKIIYEVHEPIIKSEKITALLKKYKYQVIKISQSEFLAKI